MGSPNVFNGNPLDDGPPPPPMTLQANNFVPSQSGTTAFRVAVRYRGVSGLTVAPAAAGLKTQNNDPQDQTATQGQPYRMQSPQMWKFVWWEAQTEDGTIPDIPHPQPSYNEVLVDFWIDSPAPVLPADGGDERTFRMAGCYVYQLLLPRRTTDGFFFPVMTTDNADFGEEGFVTEQATFVTGVLGPQGGGGVPAPAGFDNAGNTPTGAEGLFP